MLPEFNGYFSAAGKPPDLVYLWATATQKQVQGCAGKGLEPPWPAPRLHALALLAVGAKSLFWQVPSKTGCSCIRYALDGGNGALKWKFTTGDDSDAGSSVAIGADGTVYIGWDDNNV